MQLKTKDLIHIIPFSDDVRTQLLKEYDSMDPVRKDTVVELLWNTYEALYALKLDENTQLALQRAENGEEKLDSGFYDRVKEKTKQDMRELTVKDVDEGKLEEARKAMELIVKEIQASKRN